MKALAKSLLARLARYRERRYYAAPLQRLDRSHPEADPLPPGSPLDIVTVAFNNPLVIDYQIRLVRTNVLDDHCHVVADNSTDAAMSRAIREVCERLGCPYLALPPINPYRHAKSSHSHGCALNWLYRNYITPRRPASFGFLDHDVFPVRPTRPRDLLTTHGLWGVVEERPGIWYLWPGLCFFRFDLVAGKPIDFLPGGGGDTGARNWSCLYASIPRAALRAPDVILAELRPGSDKQADCIQFIGDWIHTINASEWKLVPDRREKERLVRELLDRYV